MSIILESVSKKYDQQLAVNNVSFEASAGEIIGFLGPNGAGKSTTMKMITGYIPPTEGSISVCGIDVLEDPVASKTCIGYLPEHNPLYLDMYVKEYLGFVARLRKIKNVKSRIAEVINTTGLEKEQHKLIKNLSKGYRQRVGLAQAIIHEPDVIILDEPTSGLDPNQLVEIRALIKKLGKEKTVMLSTHIMQEVEALCDRVIIIKDGLIVADKPVASLQSDAKAYKTLILELESEIPIGLLQEIPGVESVHKRDGCVYLIEYRDEQDPRKLLLKTILDQDNILHSLSNTEQNIESIFQNLTRS